MERPRKSDPPTLYEWAGGMEHIEHWITHFYGKVVEDPLLEPLFREMDSKHQQHVAWFIAEVLGGPPTYSRERKGHATMVRHHLNKNITEQQRKRWMHLLMESADETGLPDDPEFRSALVSYIEWGTRLAVINSKPGEDPSADEPMPKWGWGETGGPYQDD